jgi:hypothetical protein
MWERPGDPGRPTGGAREALEETDLPAHVVAGGACTAGAIAGPWAAMSLRLQVSRRAMAGLPGPPAIGVGVGVRSDVDSISLTLTVVDWSSEVKHFPHHRAKSLIYQARAPLSALCDVGGLRGSGALQRSLLPSCYQSLGELLVI